MSKSISKSYRKFIASAAAMTVVVPMVVRVASVAAETELTDIAGHRHEVAIKALVADKIINGFPDGEFKADQHQTWRCSGYDRSCLNFRW